MNDKTDMLHFILRGKNRLKVYEALLTIPFRGLQPRDIKIVCEFDSYSTISRTLKDLINKGIIKCSNKNTIRGRLYSLTPEALKLKEALYSALIS